MHKIIANIASIAHVASGVLDNPIAIAIAHIARSERALRDLKIQAAAAKYAHVVITPTFYSAI